MTSNSPPMTLEPTFQLIRLLFQCESQDKLSPFSGSAWKEIFETLLGRLQFLSVLFPAQVIFGIAYKILNVADNFFCFGYEKLALVCEPRSSPDSLKKLYSDLIF